jgi:hypothetical protein
MSPKTAMSIRLDEALLEAMKRVKDEVGIPITTQLEKAGWEWLARQGYIKADRKRASPRKRP